MGHRIDPLDPRPEDIDIRDIAHGLAYQPRWGGQGAFGNDWYSIAEHSVCVSAVVYNRTKDRALAYDALMHDAPEAYILDVPRPIKRQLNPAYAGLETRFAVAIQQALGGRITEMPIEVKQVDDQILHNEALRFMLSARIKDPDWQLGTNPIPNLMLFMVSPARAEQEFLNTYARLRP